MKRLKKILLFLLPLLLVILLTVSTMFLNPGWAYPMKTSIRQFQIYHTAPLEPGWEAIMDSVHQRLIRSDIYDESLSIKLCLNDGSSFPGLVERVAGPSFAFAGVNVIIMESEHDLVSSQAHRGDLSYDLVSLLTHEAIHCYQYHHQGFWGANPIAGHPTWKWEGYAELMGRGINFPADSAELAALWKASQSDEWVMLSDSSQVHPSYLQFALMSHQCLQDHPETFDEFLMDTRPEVFWASKLDNQTKGQ